MLKDNQLSTVLLLVALGFLIYYLAKPCPTNNGVQPPRQERQAVTEGEVREGFAEPETIPPVMQQEVSRQADAEAEQRGQTRNAALVEAPVNQNSVFNFEANDLQQSGASLDMAFERPLPQEARTDVVDINRNNVKNYDAKEFLPKEVNDQWFETDFSQAKFNINDDKLINTERYVIGVNTVGQSLKNASYDIRGTIPNPKFTVSPWNNSTYEPDTNLKSLC